MTTKNKPEKQKINIKPTELRNIMSEYIPDQLNDSEELYNIKQAITALPKSDQIIFILYTELESEKKVSDLLGVSRSPIHKLLSSIKKEIKLKINDID